MSKQSQDHFDDPIQQEALAVARSVQRPGQTKEQTKLIAQGIAKGIELYKKQQSAKARERDKARKRHLRLRASNAAEPSTTGEFSSERQTDGSTAPLRVGGVVFAVFALAHGVRLIAGWPLIVGAWAVPPALSGAAALAMLALAVWLLRCASAQHHY